jgi:Divergent InlB B-repeat domain
MGVWGAVAGAAVLAAACGGKSGTSGPGSQGGPPPPPPPAQHFLTVSKNGSGSVRSTPAGIDCGTTCSAIVAEGTQMVLIPVPDPGWQFAGWGGGCSGLGGCALKVAADTKVFVTFEAVAPATAGKHNVTVTASGAGAGRVSSSPAGIDCGSSCAAQFADGTKVVFNATPAAGSTFAGWSGACAGTTTTCELSVTTDLQLGAAFDGTATTPPSNGWISTAGADVVAMATDPSGGTIALFVDPSAPLPVGLRKLDAKGKEVWTRFFDGSTNTIVDPASSLATDGSGDIYLMWASSCADFGCKGTIDFGDGATAAAALVKLDTNGKLVWEKRLSEDGANLAVNVNGDAVIRSWASTDPSTTDVVRVSADGSQVWTATSRGLSKVGIDDEGNVVAGATTSQANPIFGQTFTSAGPVVAKLASANGSVMWAKRVAEGVVGDIDGIGVDASGAIVAAGHFGGAFDFGGQHFDTAGNAGLMFVFAADGKERVARTLPDTFNSKVLLAVDPSGRTSLAGASSATSAWVAMYDLAGSPLNSGTLQTTGALALHSIAVSVDHNTALGGNFTGTIDSGSGATTAQTQQGFVVNLGK